MAYKYSTKSANAENTAKAVGISLPISLKKSVEVCGLLRGKSLQRAKEILTGVIAEKTAVPFKRYKRDIGHKAGMAAGRYPVKTAKEILGVLESAEANAQFKGLNTSGLVIKHICAQKASRTMHYGRHRRQAKRTHVEAVLGEKGEKRAEKNTAKETHNKPELQKQGHHEQHKVHNTEARK